MNETRNQIAKDIHERQIQFVYYLIGLNVASIGFTVSQTIDEKLSINHLLIAGGYLMWIMSIFLGFRYVALSIHMFKMNMINFEIDHKGRSFDVINSKAARNYKWLQYLFYLGLVFFMTWYILRMINNS